MKDEKAAEKYALIKHGDSNHFGKEEDRKQSYIDHLAGQEHANSNIYAVHEGSVHEGMHLVSLHGSLQSAKDKIEYLKKEYMQDLVDEWMFKESDKSSEDIILYLENKCYDCMMICKQVIE